MQYFLFPFEEGLCNYLMTLCHRIDRLLLIYRYRNNNFVTSCSSQVSKLLALFNAWCLRRYFSVFSFPMIFDSYSGNSNLTSAEVWRCCFKFIQWLDISSHLEKYKHVNENYFHKYAGQSKETLKILSHNSEWYDTCVWICAIISFVSLFSSFWKRCNDPFTLIVNSRPVAESCESAN